MMPVPDQLIHAQDARCPFVIYHLSGRALMKTVSVLLHGMIARFISVALEKGIQ